MRLFPVRVAKASPWWFQVLMMAALAPAFAGEAKVFILDPRFGGGQIRWEERTWPWVAPALFGGPRLDMAPDGKIWVAGSVLAVNGDGRQIVRLNRDGNVDASFRAGDSLGEVTGMAADK